jgi:hypothetical protein
MQLKDIQIGKVVSLFYTQDVYGKVFISPNFSATTLAATVITSVSGSVLLGWRAGELMPCNAFSNGLYPLYAGTIWLNSQYEINGVLENYSVVADNPKELQCKNKTCQKMNDFGSKKCWYCLTENPTSYA